jgi:photosystem II stability/assembly factor-like uncharacterized protein
MNGSLKNTALSFIILMAFILSPLNEAVANTWANVSSGVTQNLLSVSSVRDNNVFVAVGSSGTIARSDDYGATWSAIQSNTINNINDVSLSAGNRGYIVGDNGLLRTTNDQGQTWTVLNSQTNKRLNAVHSKGADTVVFAGNDGYLAISYDSGANFTPLASNTSDELYNIGYFGENGYIVGNNGRLIRSINGGANWFTVQSVTTNALRDIGFFDANIGIAVGASGTLIRTINGGTSWSVISSGTTQDITSLSIDRARRTATATLSNGSILRTTDAGSSWTVSTTSTTSRLNSVSFADSQNGIAVGAGGSIIATGNGQPPGLVSIIAPITGQYLVSNKSLPIRWSSQNIDSLHISYSLDDGASWARVAKVRASQGIHNWTVPVADNENARIKLSSTVDSTRNAISGRFIIKEYRLTLVTPNGGESLPGGANAQVSWLSDNISNINIEFSTDNGTSWNILGNSIPAAQGNTTVTLPLAGTSDGRIRISSSDNSQRNDMSDASFTVVGPEINILTPVASESWSAGETRNISWNSVSVNRLKIEYSVDGGTNWQTIAPAVAASNNTFSWTVPNMPTNNAKIRLTDTLNPTIRSVSSEFTINRFPINLTSPNGGEVIKSGTDFPITWTSSFIQSIDIAYSIDNGNRWQTIADNVSASSGTFNWSVPEIITGSLKVRIRNSNDSLNLDISDNNASVSGIRIIDPVDGKLIIKDQDPFYLSINWESIGVDNVNVVMDATAGRTVIASNLPAANTVAATFTNVTTEEISIKVFSTLDSTIQSTSNVRIGVPVAEVIYPNGGEYLGQGRIERLRFSSEFTEKVDLKYFDGTNEYVIAADIDPANGTFDWTVPTVLSNSVVFRIYNTQNGQLLDESDNVFTITDEKITVLTPNGGELFFPSERHLISWDANSASFVDIEYITRNGNRADTFSIATRQPVVPSGMNWIVPNTPGEEVSLIIKDSDKPGIYDTTDAPLKLAGIKLTSFENTGEKVLVGSRETLRWIAVESGNINIEYSIDNGTNWISIAQNYPSSVGFYNWMVPNSPGTQTKLRIWQTEDSNVESISQSFEITGVSLLSPNGGERWLIGTDRNITWNLSDNSRVKLDYSVDGGNNWRIIVADLPGTPSTYSWDIPENASENAIVRVTLLGGSQMSDRSDNPFSIVGDGIVIATPNGGESWPSGSTQQITWSSRNVDSIALAYTYDGGRMWTMIDTVAASDLSYNWTLPSSSTLKYLVRAFDIKSPIVADTSDNFFAVTGGSGFDVPANWDVISQTGLSSTVIIESDVFPIVAGDTIEVGDAIGFFYYDNGIAKCGGYGKWDNSNLAINLWGDNTLTSAKDGFGIREDIEVRVWDASAAREYFGTATWNGNSTFTTNSVSNITALTTNRRLTIPITSNRWQLVSSNIVPPVDSIANILSPVRTFLSFAKDQDGAFYYPAIDINDIEVWDMQEAYMIYLWSTRTLTIEGVPAVVRDYSYDFDAMKWYFIGYLPQQEMPISQALAPISSLIMVKDTDGNIYYPAEGINNITNMSPGNGYQIISSQDINNFQYPFNAELISGGEAFDESGEDEWYFDLAAEATGSSSVIIFRSDDISAGDEVAVMYGDIICGRSVVSAGKAAVTVWGDNPESVSVDGALPGEVLDFKLYDVSENSEKNIKINSANSILSGENADIVLYQPESIIHAEGSAITSSVALEINNDIELYPNPATTSISITGIEGFSEIVILNMKGEEVLRSKNSLIDIQELISGVYMVSVYSDTGIIGQTKFQVSGK